LVPFTLPSASAEVPFVIIDGPAVQVSSAAAQRLSMALHEMATNATKHGALSIPSGRLAAGWSVDHVAGLLSLRWDERCGPPIAAPPSRRGFGMRA
jgi:two-component sensor histidine kinase